MHDLGRFGLMAAYPTLSASALAPVYENAAQALEEERRLFGMDHAQAGACLTQVWGLPVEFQEVSGRHHDAEAAGDSGSVAVVWAACQAADALGYEGVRKTAGPALEEILSALPTPVAARARGVDLARTVAERFQALGSSLEP